MADGRVVIDVDVEIKQAEKQLEEVKRIAEDSGEEVSRAFDVDIDNLEKQMQKAKNKIEETNIKLTETKRKLDDLQQIDKLNLDRLEAQQMLKEIEEEFKRGEINLDVKFADTKLIKESIVEIDNEIAKLSGRTKNISFENLSSTYERQKIALDNANLSMGVLGNKATNLGNKITQANNKANELNSTTKKVDSSMKKASTSAGNVTNGISKGISRLGKYALALFSIRSIYQSLSRLSRQWLNSDDEGARQVRANIEAMSSALSNALAPVITYIANLLATVFGYANAILKAFFGIDLLAKKTSKNVGGVASGAKKARKEAERFTSAFDKADIATEKIADNLGGAGGGANMDLPSANLPEMNVPKWVDKLIEDLKPFTKIIKGISFDSLVKNFDKLSKSSTTLLDTIYNSFIRVTNKAIAPFIKIMTENIVPKLFDGLANALDTLTPHFEWLLKNLVEPFIEFLLLDLAPVSFDLLLSLFNLLIPAVDLFMGGIEALVGVLTPFAILLSGAVLVALELVIKAVERLTEELNKEESALADIIKVIGFLIGAYATFKGSMLVVVGAIAGLTKIATLLATVFGKVLTIVKLVAGFFAGAFSGSILAIIALVALLGTMLVGLVTNFDQVKKDIGAIIKNIKEIFSGLGDFIAGVFTGDWKRAWNGVVKIFDNIISGIANIFKLPINSIIDGINIFIRSLNRIKIPSWVPAVGGKGFNIPTMQRLATGGFASSGAMNVIFGENGREVALPLDNNSDRWANPLSDALMAKMGNSGGTETVNLVVSGHTLATINLQEEKKRKILMNGAYSWT